MSVRVRVWLVWEEEYPDEGSVEIRATSAQTAKAAYRRQTGEPDTPLRAVLMTPAIRVKRYGVSP